MTTAIILLVSHHLSVDLSEWAYVLPVLQDLALLQLMTKETFN